MNKKLVIPRCPDCGRLMTWDTEARAEIYTCDNAKCDVFKIEVVRGNTNKPRAIGASSA